MTRVRARKATEEARWTKYLILGAMFVFLALVLVLPLVSVFVEALRKGLAEALINIKEPDAVAAIKLTLLTAAISVPFNAAFGVCASWAIAKHSFPGKAFLITLIDLP